MVQVLAHLLRGSRRVSLCDPVFQVLHLSAQQEVVVGVVQLLPAVLGQLLQPGVLLIYLSLTPDDLLAADEVKGARMEGNEKRGKEIGFRFTLDVIRIQELSHFTGLSFLSP